jgi:hypothetical protein
MYWATCGLGASGTGSCGYLTSGVGLDSGGFISSFMAFVRLSGPICECAIGSPPQAIDENSYIDADESRARASAGLTAATRVAVQRRDDGSDARKWRIFVDARGAGGARDRRYHDRGGGVSRLGTVALGLAAGCRADVVEPSTGLDLQGFKPKNVIVVSVDP